MQPALPRSDVAVFASWIVSLHQYGTQGFYAHTPGVDYVPGYLLVLHLLGMLYAPFAAHDHQGRLLQSLVRFPAILADTALVAVAVCYARKVQQPPIAAILLAVSPALLLLTSYWGQVDAIAVALLIGSILATLADAVGLSWLIFAVALVVKPQPFVVGPLLLLWQLQRRHFSALCWAPGATALLCYLVSLPFTPLRNPLSVWQWFLAHYVSGISKYPFASVNAFNLFGFFGRIYTPDSERVFGLTLQTWGLGLFALVLSGVLVKLWYDWQAFPPFEERVQQLMVGTTVVLFALFMLTTRMHERYLFAALATMTIAFRARDRRWLYLTLALHLNFLINEVFTLAGLHDRWTSRLSNMAVALFSLENCLIFGFVAWIFFFQRFTLTQPQEKT